MHPNISQGSSLPRSRWKQDVFLKSNQDEQWPVEPSLWMLYIGGMVSTIYLYGLLIDHDFWIPIHQPGFHGMSRAGCWTLLKMGFIRPPWNSSQLRKDGSSIRNMVFVILKITPLGGCQLWLKGVLPIRSMYGTYMYIVYVYIYTYIYREFIPNVRKYTIHGSYGLLTAVSESLYHICMFRSECAGVVFTGRRLSNLVW